MVIAVLTFKVPLGEINALSPEHRAFLQVQHEAGICAAWGRRKGDIGGVILMNVGTQEEAKAILQEDPYWVRQMADYTFYDFTPNRSFDIHL